MDGLAIPASPELQRIKGIRLLRELEARARVITRREYARQLATLLTEYGQQVEPDTYRLGQVEMKISTRQ